MVGVKRESGEVFGEHQIMSRSSGIISVNVGGKIFTTTVATLTQEPESMLATMFSTEVPQVKDSNGNIFIDKNPKTFEIILDFLRSGQLIYDKESNISLRQLEVDADYFGLSGLQEVIRKEKCEDEDDGTRELILVMIFREEISGPMLRLKVDRSSRGVYTFRGVGGFLNAMLAQLPGLTTENGISKFKGGLNDKLKNRRSVWFCYRISSEVNWSEERRFPKALEMMDAEAKILNGWDHYWESAEDCEKSKAIDMTHSSLGCLGNSDRPGSGFFMILEDQKLLLP